MLLYDDCPDADDYELFYVCVYDVLLAHNRLMMIDRYDCSAINNIHSELLRKDLYIYIQICDHNDEDLILLVVVFQTYLNLIDLLIFLEMEEIHDDQSC
jgi:hypothetical protein